MSQSPGWQQDSSDVYRQLAQVAVPARAEQIAVLLSLFPFSPDDSFRVVELASGEGRLSQAILMAYPHAQLLSLDGEPSMRDETAQRVAPFGERAQVALFNMELSDWYPQVEGVNVVVSSLCVHHLDGAQKHHLFGALFQRLAAQGALLLADLVAPQREEVRALFAATWDASAQTQAGDSGLYDLFRAEQWNYYQHPDPFDKPSPLFQQLQWLHEVGFSGVDCFWMQAGHAIYGGYKGDSMGRGLAFEDALHIGRKVTM